MVVLQISKYQNIEILRFLSWPYCKTCDMGTMNCHRQSITIPRNISSDIYQTGQQLFWQAQYVHLWLATPGSCIEEQSFSQWTASPRLGWAIILNQVQILTSRLSFLFWGATWDSKYSWSPSWSSSQWAGLRPPSTHNSLNPVGKSLPQICNESYNRPSSGRLCATLQSSSAPLV